MEPSKAFCLWSGGKDCHLALFRAQEQGLDVSMLITFFDERTRRSLSHHLPPRLLRDQADLLGIYLQEVYVPREGYEQRLRSIMTSLLAHGVTHAVFGDISLEEHRTWNERISRDCGMIPVFPLWGNSVEAVFDAQRDFHSLIVCVDPEQLDERWLGRPVDEEFRQSLLSRGLDICGEKGEYHTLVVQSPLMKGLVQVERWKKSAYDAYIGMDIQEWSVLQLSRVDRAVATLMPAG